MRNRLRSDVMAKLVAGILMAPSIGCTEALAPGEAAISVTVKVAGSFPSDGFQIEVDGRANKLTAADKSVVVGGLSRGTHTVSLGEIPSGCVANGDTKLVVETSGANQPAVEFHASCFRTGLVAIAVSVVGRDGPVSLAASVDAHTPLTLVTGNTTIVLGDFAAGYHVVHLFNVPPGCEPGAIPQPPAFEVSALSAPVNVLTGGVAPDTAIASFTIYCDSAADRSLGRISGTLGDSDTQGDLVEGSYAEIIATQVNGTASATVRLHTSFTLQGLYPGRWQLAISTMHGWTAVFPGLHLYADTTVTVDVTAGQTTVLPPILLRPRPLLLLIGVHTCPFPLPDPPTVDDWDNGCEGGFWGGAHVEVDVKGVEGTPTAGEHFRALMGQGGSVPGASWSSNYWSTAFNLAVPGDYDVTVVSVVPSAFTDPRASLRLVPWEKSITRVSVTRVFGYLGLDFWIP